MNNYYGHHILKEGCGICGGNKTVIRHLISTKTYLSIEEVFKNHKKSLSFRIKDEMEACFLKKNMCKVCRGSLSNYTRCAVKKMTRPPTINEIELLSTDWLSTRLKGIIRHRVK